jgi:glycogen phosphorylase
MTVEPLLSRYVRSITGRAPRFASEREWLAAIAALVRDQAAEHPPAAAPRDTGSVRRVSYLSMEFLPGRLLRHALQNLGLYDSCKAALSSHGVDLDQLAEHETDPALGSGGLGRLAACLLDGMANLGLRAQAYGMRYDCGLFAQHIVDGWQVEKPQPWTHQGNPWEIVRRDLTFPVQFGGWVEPRGEGPRAPHLWTGTDDVLATAHDLPVIGAAPRRLYSLRLWSAHAAHELDLRAFNGGEHQRAFSRRNEVEALSQVLYPGDTTLAGRELRFKQEYFFASASIQDILRRFRRLELPLERLPDEFVVQINDTHPALAIVELIRLLVDLHGIPWARAFELTRRSFAYTNHTLLPEALEVWPVQFFERFLPRHLQIIYELNGGFLAAVTRQRPHDMGLISRVSLIDEHGGRSVRMANLAVVGSARVNGVSEVHTALMRETSFADFDRLFPGRIVNVTNGIAFRRWLRDANPGLTRLVEDHTGTRWRDDTRALRALEPYADLPDFRAAFRAVKRANKARLGALVERTTGVRPQGGMLFDVHVKRIHEYKRQLLKLLHIVALYERARSGSEILPRFVLFAGKAAPGYAAAKLIVKLIHDVAACVNGDETLEGQLRVAFVPDYDVSKAQVIMPAADLSEQISTAGYEASGTGNMKLALNGALTMGTLDGANIEIRDAVGAENFFAFGADIEGVKRIRAQGYDPQDHLKRSAELWSAVALIGSGHFSPADPNRFRPILDQLLHHDPYLIGADFASYLAVQDEAEALYRNEDEWSRRAILNVARMGGFSADASVRRYAELIWRRQPEEALGAAELIDAAD